MNDAVRAELQGRHDMLVDRLASMKERKNDLMSELSEVDQRINELRELLQGYGELLRPQVVP